MIHYNIWFNLRDTIGEADALETVKAFLSQLCVAGSISGFQLLRNSGEEGKTKLLRYQALIEFRDEAQFSTAFSAQAARGIRTGLHGRVMALVSDFRIEILRQIAASIPAVTVDPCHFYGCEV
jgi:hypothetical protein